MFNNFFRTFQYESQTRALRKDNREEDQFGDGDVEGNMI